MDMDKSARFGGFVCGIMVALWRLELESRQKLIVEDKYRIVVAVVRWSVGVEVGYFLFSGSSLLRLWSALSPPPLVPRSMQSHGCRAARVR